MTRVIIATNNARNYRNISDVFARSRYFFVGDVLRNGKFEVIAILKNKERNKFGNVAFDIVHDLIKYEPEIVIAKNFGANAKRELSRYGIVTSNKLEW